MNPTEHPITEDDIANFLANTPDFFERHATLLATVQSYLERSTASSSTSFASTHSSQLSEHRRHSSG